MHRCLEYVRLNRNVIAVLVIERYVCCHYDLRCVLMAIDGELVVASVSFRTGPDVHTHMPWSQMFRLARPGGRERDQQAGEVGRGEPARLRRQRGSSRLWA
jgi:hypothetical protein